jgi:hypothetical protein
VRQRSEFKTSPDASAGARSCGDIRRASANYSSEQRLRSWSGGGGNLIYRRLPKFHCHPHNIEYSISLTDFVTGFLHLYSYRFRHGIPPLVFLPISSRDSSTCILTDFVTGFRHLYSYRFRHGIPPLVFLEVMLRK